MIRKYRLIMYAVVGLTIPVLSYIMYPELGVAEPLIFIAFVLVVGTVTEVVMKLKGFK